MFSDRPFLMFRSGLKANTEKSLNPSFVFVLTRLYTLRHAKSYDEFVFKSVVNELKHPETSTNVTKFWETSSFYREEEKEEEEGEEETTKKNWSTFYDLEQTKWTRKSYNSDSMGSKSRFVVCGIEQELMSLPCSSDNNNNNETFLVKQL